MREEPAQIEDTLRAAQQGSRGAFADLVESHQSMVYSLLVHMLGEEAVAEEIAQDVFLELHKNLDAIDSAVHLARWLRTVASRRGIDEVRRRRFRSPYGIEDLPEPRIEPRVRDVMLSAQVRRMLERLPARHRAIVVLRYQEDLEPGEIAVQLEMPVATVKSTLHRALGMLRRACQRTGLGGREFSKREAV